MQNDPKRSQVSRARREALPYEWDQLTADQQRVAEELHKYLVDFVSLPLQPKRPPGPFSWQLDHHRESNVVLFDGGRGSGKTSVLLTVIELWLRVLRGEPTSSAPQPIVTMLQRGELAGKLIPLRILDLQPLPRSTSLLTWLAGRLLEFVDDLEGGNARERGAPPAPIGSWNPKWEVELPSRKAWRELLQDAATGWESNLSQRRKDLDPESYAVELGQAERARLSIQDRWREFVDRVADDAHQRLPALMKPDARFVLSIDDADMNPHRCVELLDLLRMFWHPRLVFVLTGETDLFIKTLQLHYLGRFREATGPTALIEGEYKEILAKPSALGLAWNTYNKAIPRGQRFSLPELQPEERLKFLREDLAVELRHREEGLPPASLVGYFELDPFLQHGLPDRLRRIQDLKQQLSDPALRRRASLLVYRLWRDKVKAGDFSQPLEKALLGSVQLRDEMLFVQLENELAWMSRNFGVRRRLLGASFQLELNVSEGFNYDPLDNEFQLPKSLVALLLLALNVAEDEVDGEVPDEELPRGFGYSLVNAIVPVGTKEAQFVWPLPTFTSPVEVNLLMSMWTPSNIRRALSDKDPGALAHQFIAATLSAHARHRLEEPLPDAKDIWKQLVTKVRDALTHIPKEDSKDIPRQRQFNLWLREGAGLLATPESGLPPSTANEILESLFSAVPVELHATLIANLKRSRRENARRALRGTEQGTAEGLYSFLKELDASNTAFNWGTLVENRPPAPKSGGAAPTGPAKK